MKSLVLSKQDARELEKLGGLTIAKIMRPAPPYIEGADFAERLPGWVLVCPDLRPYGEPDGEAAVFLPPVNPGDATYIREPWYRLRDPKNGEPSDRVILAADSTVKDDETAYKWASPVSMPETAARRFVRVLGVSPVYSRTGATWEIKLEQITKDEAQAIDAGLPVSSAEDAESGSGRYAYAGDMSPEDYDRMNEAIDADQLHLSAVQERIVWITVRRAYIRDTMGDLEGTGKKDMALVDEDSALAEEIAALADEEEEIRAALEDALEGPVGGVERFAKNTLSEIARELAAIGEDGGSGAAQLEERKKMFSDYLEIIGEKPAAGPSAGACRYCGQLQEVGPHETQADADETASEVRNCPGARAARRERERVEDAQERVHRLFGEGAEELGFRPVHDDAVDLLDRVVELIAKGPISSASLNIRGQCKAKFSITSKGKIKVSRSETCSCDLEAGE